MSATNPNDQYEFFKYIKLTEDGRLLVEAAGVVNDTYVEAGSVDVPNSELVLLRTDGVEVRIDAAEFLSDAFVTGGVYDPLTSTITFTNNLGGSFVVTGFQLSTTASNGLNEVGNDVRLGGPLTEDTTITGDALNDIGLTYNGNFKVDSSLFGYSNSLEMRENFFQILQDGDGEATIDFYLGAEDGLYLNRTRGAQIFNLEVPSDNSLTIVSTKTTISSPDQGIRLYGRQVGADSFDKSELSLGESGFIGLISRNSTLGDSAISIVENGVTRPNSFINFDSPEFYFKSNVTDVTQRGAKYGGPNAGGGEDYSISWDGTTPDSILTTKGYVDRLVTSGITASNGLTEIGNDIQLGGTLTKDTNIQSNTEIFTITADNGSDNSQIYIKSDDGVGLYANTSTANSKIELGPTNLDIEANAISLEANNNLTLLSKDSLVIRANVNGAGGAISIKAEASEITSEAREINMTAGAGDVNIESEDANINIISDLELLVQSTNVKLSSGIDLILGDGDIIFEDTKLDISKRGAIYPTDYTQSWNDNTEESRLPTKGYVDRKTLYSIPFGRNGNVVSNSYLRGSGNVIGNVSRGELITQDSRIEAITYRIENANSTGNFIFDIKLINSDGSLAQSQSLIFNSQPGEVFSVDLPPFFFGGWGGLVNTSQMLAFQFRSAISGTITQINNPQITLKMSVR